MVKAAPTSSAYILVFIFFGSVKKNPCFEDKQCNLSCSSIIDEDKGKDACNGSQTEEAEEHNRWLK